MFRFRVSLIIACALRALAAAAIAEQQPEPQPSLPDAAAATKNLYHEVTFQDVIKAVSKSKTHDGYYLSFGAPYPKQVLTVWASNETYRLLPGATVLVGRTVRISGLVDPSPSGPIIYLQSPAQFRLLPVDPATVSKPLLDGRADRHQFVMAVRHYLYANDFDTLETLSSDLHESHERFVDGIWLLDAFFGAFNIGLGPEWTDKSYSKRVEAIRDWKGRYPESILPHLVEARLHYDVARKWRDIDDPAKLSDEDWRHVREEMATSRQILESHPEAKTSPDYYLQMLRIARWQGWSRSEYFKLFNDAVARWPDYDTFYTEAAFLLSPKWYGEKGEWEAFAEQQREKLGGPAGDACYTRIAWSRADDYRHHLFEKTAISWPKMAAGFEALMRQYPDSNYLKSAYAWFAWEAQDRDRLGPALEAIKSKPDMDIWVNLENLQFARKFLNGERVERAH